MLYGHNEDNIRLILVYELDQIIIKKHQNC